ncbi:cation-transporting P-type ATPase [Kitasatospora sp. NPDC058048]|uniref:cation-transporting P-type ATPase n=1 Tax=Kitasatospora sp. NPDC058048 TaxID=3346313 RepID=UPI0036D99B7F
MTVSANPRARGLTGSEAARLLAEHGRNEVAADRRVPLWARVAAQLRDPLITVLHAAVALTVAIGDHPDAAALRQADIGVAMGAEPASPGAMTRPPRPPDQHILGSGVWQRVLLLAAVVAACSTPCRSAGPTWPRPSSPEPSASRRPGCSSTGSDGRAGRPSRRKEGLPSVGTGSASSTSPKSPGPPDRGGPS